MATSGATISYERIGMQVGLWEMTASLTLRALAMRRPDVVGVQYRLGQLAHVSYRHHVRNIVNATYRMLSFAWTRGFRVPTELRDLLSWRRLQ